MALRSPTHRLREHPLPFIRLVRLEGSHETDMIVFILVSVADRLTKKAIEHCARRFHG